MKKTRLKGIVNVFPNDYNPIDTGDILDIHRYLMKEKKLKQCFELLRKCLLYF